MARGRHTDAGIERVPRLGPLAVIVAARGRGGRVVLELPSRVYRHPRPEVRVQARVRSREPAATRLGHASVARAQQPAAADTVRFWQGHRPVTALTPRPARGGGVSSRRRTVTRTVARWQRAPIRQDPTVWRKVW